MSDVQQSAPHSAMAFRSRLFSARSAVQLWTGLLSVSCSSLAVAQGVQTHHVREAVALGRVQAMAHVSQTQPMQLDLVLPLRDPDGLTAFLEDLYDPASGNFHHYLTPAEFTARFGPSEAQYNEVLRFAQRNGLTVTGGSRDSMDVQIKAPVAAIESAFHLNIQNFKHPEENRSFFGPDREPTTTLSFSLWHISGLDNYSIPHPLLMKRPDAGTANGLGPDAAGSPRATTGSGPSSSFLGSDMRAAYYGSGSLTGAGQNLALFEYVGTNLQDLQTYYKNIGQTLPLTPQLISTDGTSTACTYTKAGGNCDDGEQNLDMTQALGMAPGLASLQVYVGSTDTAIIGAMTTHSPLPSTIGCSWGWTPADPSTLDPYFKKMAAQGQSFFAASGDSSTWSRSNEAWPADDAYVTAVGGTDLVTNGAAGSWKSETAWADSGGGISPDRIAIPSWQKAAINSTNQGSKTYRNGPDVAANANFTFYTCADQQACQANVYGGTSFAAPMWAAYTALVNQGRASQGKSGLGFLNPLIYADNATSGTYATDFHDILTGTSGSYSAVKGFDLVTGWGSPTPSLAGNLISK